MIRRAGVTTAHFVPSQSLAEFVTEETAAACTGLRRVVCSGEALPAELAARFHRTFGVPLHNLYGPTEAAVDVTACRWPRGADDTDRHPDLEHRALRPRQPAATAAARRLR